MNYTVKTKWDRDGNINQELLQESDGGITERLSAWCIRTRDVGVRQSLIALGWTPPPDAEVGKQGPMTTADVLKECPAGKGYRRPGGRWSHWRRLLRVLY